MLKLKLESSNKDKYDSYPRPQNVEFFSVSQVNRPVWDNLSYPVRTRDSTLQNIHREILTSAVPTLKVMQMLNDASDDLNQLDVKVLTSSHVM